MTPKFQVNIGIVFDEIYMYPPVMMQSKSRLGPREQ